MILGPEKESRQEWVMTREGFWQSASNCNHSRLSLLVHKIYDQDSCKQTNEGWSAFLLISVMFLAPLKMEQRKLNKSLSRQRQNWYICGSGNKLRIKWGHFHSTIPFFSSSPKHYLCKNFGNKSSCSWHLSRSRGHTVQDVYTKSLLPSLNPWPILPSSET
jgi:hypothetical protein